MNRHGAFNCIEMKIPARMIFITIMPLLILFSCKNAPESKIPFAPVMEDGRYVVSFSNLSQENFFAAGWGPPTLGGDRIFSRRMPVQGVKIRFVAMKQESYVLKLKVFGPMPVITLISGTHTQKLSEAVSLIEKKMVLQGENTWEFVPEWDCRVVRLELTPTRALKTRDSDDRIHDKQTLFIPGRLRYWLRSTADETLSITLDLGGIKRLPVTIRLWDESGVRKSSRNIFNLEPFSIRLSPGIFQEISIDFIGQNNRYVRLLASERIGKLPADSSRESRFRQIKEKVSAKNVVIFLLDAARPDHFGYSGYHRPTTPNIDRISRMAITFPNAYAEASYTLASTGTLLTGLSPDIHGVVSEWFSSLDRRIPTLPGLFRKKKYFTGAICANPFAGKAYHYDRGFQVFRELYDAKPAPPAADFILPFREMLASTGGRPFFVYLHIREPHDPYTSTPPYFGKFQNVFKSEAEMPFKKADKFFIDYKTDLDKLAILGSLYDENLAYADWAVGLLLQELTAAGLSDRTVKIVLADHGEALGENGFIGHGQVVYQPGIRIPLMIEIPGVPPGQITKQVLTSDVPLTLADLFDLPFANRQASRGENLFSPGRGSRCIISRSTKIHGYPVYAITEFPYKLIVNFPLDPQRTFLFDLESDPGELNPLSNKKIIRETLLFELFQYLQRAAEMNRSTKTPNLEKSHRESLKSLGYLS